MRFHRLTVAAILGLTPASCVRDTALEPASSSKKETSPTGLVANAAGRPNIVVIMTDDQTMGDMRVLTKTRSLIGAAGVTFTKNVVTYALCCPSRATFLTGQYPHNHGVRGNVLPSGGITRLDASNTLPLWLQEAGYATGHIGKYLNGYGEADSLARPPGYTEWYGSLGESAYRYYDYFMNENGKLVRYGSTSDQYQTDVYTAKAADFIRRRGQTAAMGGEPFFLFVTYLAPHWGGPTEPGDPSIQTPVPAPRHKGRFAAEVLPKSPAFNEADMSDKPASFRKLPLLTTAQVGEIRQSHRQRLESLLAVDEGVAQIINALEVSGTLQNTLVIFTSDNGWFQGEHRKGFGKISPYEPAVKVPLLIRGPGVVAGRVVTAAVANIDLAPTILATAGAMARRTMDGRSLWPLLQGEARWPTAYGPRHLMVETDPAYGAASRFWSIRRGQYVYTEWANGDRELYNLTADSAQVASRHKDPAYATLRTQLSNRLAAMRTCSGVAACW